MPRPQSLPNKSRLLRPVAPTEPRLSPDQAGRPTEPATPIEPAVSAKLTGAAAPAEAVGRAGWPAGHPEVGEILRTKVM